MLDDDDLGMPMGKRAAPDEVLPVVIDNIEYQVIHWGKERGLDQNGGYIAAVDKASKEELWILKVYNIEYDPDLEEDVQDIFIEALSVGQDKKTLLIIDERGLKHVVDLSTRAVQEV